MTKYIQADEDENLQHLAKGIVRIGDGRGFVVECDEQRYVITCTHCLPLNDDGYLKIPAVAVAGSEERTFRNIIGPLDEEPTIWTECYSADPATDIAVLGPVDGQMFAGKDSAFEEFVEAKPHIEIGATPDPKFDPQTFDWRSIETPPEDEEVPGFLFSLDRRWFSAKILVPAFRRRGSCSLGIAESASRIRGGMSGSPVIYAGKAVGILATDNWANPRLAHHLLAWMMK
jgi:hypothetical protein